MTFKFFLMAGALGALAACQPAVPDSGAGAPGRGVGFDNSLEAQRQREAELAGARAPTTIPAAAQVASSALPAAPAGGQPPSDQTAAGQPPRRPSTSQNQEPLNLDAQTAALEDAENASATAANSGRQVVNASPSNPVPLAVDNAGISDENDFDAVAGRQSIVSDKARIEANRAQYSVVQPTALPTRAGNSQPNVVAYALETSHPRGTQVHRRISLVSARKSARNCAVFASSDEAQIDFLARGGPIKDRKGLDPDGDGYACGWDPAPYRAASGG
ncbi:MAG: hypothetical protein P8Q26_00210 [Ascidiaceihabitans sp.]|nr:hypothetical protein [Ascidiaceihabitans sp.]